MILRNLRIGTRLALGFGSILAVMMALVIGSGVLAERGRTSLAATLEAASTKEGLATDMKALALEQAAAMRNIGLHADIGGMQADEDRARKLGKSYDAARESFAKFELQPAERASLDVLAKLDRDVEAPFQQALGLMTSFRGEEASTVLLRELDPVVQKAQAELNKLIEIERRAYREALAESVSSGNRIALVTYVVDAIVLALAAVLAWMTTRSITVPLGEAVGVARRVASGDLTSRIDVSGRDEAAELLAALREMNDGLGGMVQRIRSGAETIAVGAGQVAAGNQSLSSRTEEHASSLEETASTLEEFTTTVKQNAEHARQASQLATTASSTAQRGGEIVGNVVDTMQEVTSSSKRISDIIAVIDGISFQTNILALNAAVEAARAGEQGRGFAVVASEVRSLAQRSAASAKEIRGLIEHSVGKVEAGARLVEHAGRTMDELVASVKKVAEIMTEIASASHEQSSGIEQINRAITQMDTVVQMNASIVEEATAAATSMAHQATELTRSVAQFRVDEAAALSSLPAASAGEAAPAARARAAVPELRRAAAPARRESAPAAPESDDWKEF